MTAAIASHPFVARLRSVDTVVRTGRVRRIMPTMLTATGPDVPLGTICSIEAPQDEPAILAEVVGIGVDEVVLAPLAGTARIAADALVTALVDSGRSPVGDALLGRAVDAMGRAIDNREDVRGAAFREVRATALAPFARRAPKQAVATGLRAIDGLLSLAEGQRVGIFAASGVGKTSLMIQLIRQVEADRKVVCLVGERGREAEALWQQLPAEVRDRTTLVVATSDQPAAFRARACDYAASIAEAWRDEGLHVALFVDSVTRLAMALREVGLAAGEPPTVRAYTPGVFAAIPRLVERCGAARDGGAITAIMTVLCEDDDADDPIAEMLKSLLDGHILLSRRLAEQGHFPAVDIPRSISRQARDIVSPAQRAAAARIMALVAAHDAARVMIEAGVYAAGSDVTIDAAIAARPAVTAFLRQADDEAVGYEATQKQLAALAAQVAA